MSAYAIVTPVRNETENLRRLAESLSAQTLRPRTWMIVDTGSDDGTPALIAELMREHDWIATCTSTTGESPTRARAIVHGFNVGVIELGVLPEVVVKLDADISIEPDYFERRDVLETESAIRASRAPDVVAGHVPLRPFALVALVARAARDPELVVRGERGH